MSRLVFDIGGTNMRIALAEEGEISSLEKIPTPRSPEEAIAALSEFVASRNTAPEDSVGGIAGIIKEGTIIDSPNLPTWNGFAFSTAVQEKLGVPVRLHNDALMAAFGEAVRGAGQDYERVGYLTVGTGVGGALIVHKALPDEGHEPGRIVIDAESGRTFESYVGGAALTREFGTRPQELPQSLFIERTRYLALGISHVLDLWAPDVLILNGALMNDEQGFFLPDVSQALEEIREGIPPLAHAMLGDSSGLIGAASV